jgi:hypothetical protein
MQNGNRSNKLFRLMANEFFLKKNYHRTSKIKGFWEPTVKTLLGHNGPLDCVVVFSQ